MRITISLVPRPLPFFNVMHRIEPRYIAHGLGMASQVVYRLRGRVVYSSTHGRIKIRATPVHLGFKHTGNDWQQVATVQLLLFYPKIALESISEGPKSNGGACPHTPLLGAQCAHPYKIQSSTTCLSNRRVLSTAQVDDTTGRRFTREGDSILSNFFGELLLVILQDNQKILN